jgi:hypothetical protein
MITFVKFTQPSQSQPNADDLLAGALFLGYARLSELSCEPL